MKVVVLASYARSLLLFRGELLSAMVGGGHEVVACAPGNDEIIAGRLRKMGVRYVPVTLDRTGMNPIRDLLFCRDMASLFRRERPGVLLSYTAKPVIYGSLAARRAGVPKVFSMVTGLGYAFTGKAPKQRLVNLIVRRLYRLGLARNDAVFFQNPDDSSLFTSLGLVAPERVVMLNGSGVNLDYYGTATPVVSTPVFLLIGRLLEDKGIREFAAAALLLKKRHPRAVFRLLGPFDTNPTAISRKDVDHWVESGIIEYLGETDDVRPYLAQTSVCVLPSYREGTPRSVLEAMAMGRPVVTTDAPGCRETVIDGENGFLVPVKDAEALARAMERFIENPGLIGEMGKRSRELAEEKYDVRKVNAVIMKTMGLSGEENL